MSVDREQDEIFRRSAQNQNTETRDEGIHATTHGSGAQIVQVETLGKSTLFVVLVMFVVIVVVGILAGYALGAATEQSVTADEKIRRMDSRVYVLEYDAARMCAALMEKNLLEACH